MPRYKIRHVLETPIAFEKDVEFQIEEATVFLRFQNRLDEGHVFVDAIVEAANFPVACGLAADVKVPRVLDALCLHRLAPAMITDFVYALKDEVGPRRKAVVQHTVVENYNVWLAPAHVKEIQDSLSSGAKLSSVVMRWLRYSYQPITALERFIYSWLALENAAGTKNITNTCPKCKSEVNERSATNWERASEILAASRTDSDKNGCAKEIKSWNRTLRNPTLHGGKATDGVIRGSMTSAQEQFRPAVEQCLRSEIGFKHALTLSKPNDGLHQIWIKNFVEFGADPNAVFPEPPDAKVIADVVTTGVLPDGVELLKYQDSGGW
ncbi:MAG TPA: hypothetical protein VG844_10865 [Terracidiphilus sp.]|nr:hypothetical protein [Terracidiphilus sp.]